MVASLRDRLRGCAVGAAVGDALGMPLKFHPQHPLDSVVREMLPGLVPAGAFTDETELSLAVAENLLAHRSLDADDLARRFGEWFQATTFEVSDYMQEVLSRLSGGTSWRRVIHVMQLLHSGHAGNGALIRCWPVALMYWDDVSALLAASRKQSRITHPQPHCLGACAFVNVMIYHLIRGTGVEESLILAANFVRQEQALCEIVDQAPAQAREDLNGTGWVCHTLESVVWALVNSDSFEDALIQAVNLGNDADTVGAVVGALAGAYYGLDAIPLRWRDALHGEWPLGSGDQWTADNFIALADALSARA